MSMVCGNIRCSNSGHVCDYLCVYRRDFCIIGIGSYFCITLGRGVLINVNYEFLDSISHILRRSVPEALWGRFVQMRYQCNYLLALLYSCWPCLRERESLYMVIVSVTYIHADGKIIKLLHSTIAVCLVCPLCLQVCNGNFYLNVSKMKKKKLF